MDAASQVLSSLRGVMLGVTFGEKPYGSIKVDFGQDVAPLKDAGPQLLLEALARHGAMVDDFAQWKPQAAGKRITLSGNLSATGMRQIFSLIETPASKSVAVAEEDEPAESANNQNTTVVATQKYFKAVDQYIADLRNKEPQRIAQYGVWFDKYARKIDDLPMLDVDSDMLDYGAYVAQQFRNAGSAIQGIGIRKRVRQVGAVNSTGTPGYYGNNYDGGYYYGGNYYNGSNGYARGNYVQSGLRQQQQVRTQVNTQEKAVGVSAARAIMKEVQNASRQVRREMTEKYHAEF